MENLIFLLATSFLFRLAPTRKVKNQPIGTTGCSVLQASDELLDSSFTNSGDQLYFHQFREGLVSYGMICVHLEKQYSLDEAEVLLGSYINKLKRPFYILHNTGLQEDADWNSEESRTMVDYWQDSQKKDWKVKGYTNGRILSVLYVKNIGQADVKNQDFFLDSFHFSANQ